MYEIIANHKCKWNIKIQRPQTSRGVFHSKHNRAMNKIVIIAFNFIYVGSFSRKKRRHKTRNVNIINFVILSL